MTKVLLQSPNKFWKRYISEESRNLIPANYSTNAGSFRSHLNIMVAFLINNICKISTWTCYRSVYTWYLILIWIFISFVTKKAIFFDTQANFLKISKKARLCNSDVGKIESYLLHFYTVNWFVALNKLSDLWLSGDGLRKWNDSSLFLISF